MSQTETPTAQYYIEWIQKERRNIEDALNNICECADKLSEMAQQPQSAPSLAEAVKESVSKLIGKP